MTKRKNPRAPISEQLPKDIADFVPGPGISKREYGLSKTAREKWIIKEVDRIIFYLRIRSNFDGVREFIPHQEYKNRRRLRDRRDGVLRRHRPRSGDKAVHRSARSGWGRLSDH